MRKWFFCHQTKHSSSCIEIVFHTQEIPTHFFVFFRFVSSSFAIVYLSFVRLFKNGSFQTAHKHPNWPLLNECANHLSKWASRKSQALTLRRVRSVVRQLLFFNCSHFGKTRTFGAFLPLGSEKTMKSYWRWLWFSFERANYHRLTSRNGAKYNIVSTLARLTQYNRRKQMFFQCRHSVFGANIGFHHQITRFGQSVSCNRS